MSAIHGKYLQDTFLQSLTTKVKSVEEDSFGVKVQLKDTIFHPKGGGQQSDKGTINGISVISVIKNPEDGSINHYIDPSKQSELATGQEASLIIDAQTRLQNAALHSAGHVLAAVVEKIYPQLKAFQAHHYPKEAKVQFKVTSTTPPLDTNEMKKQLEKAMKDYIATNLVISTLFDEKMGRRVQIGDSEPVGCGGTHLINANQLDSFSIRNIRIRKGICAIGYDAAPKVNLSMHDMQEVAH